MGQLRILVVDDHAAIRSGIKALLSPQEEWMVCGEAGDGLEAISKAKELRPDIVLMDISMPRMDGLQARRIISRDLPSCDIVVVTQNEPTIARQQASAVSAKGFITKSELAQELVSTIEKIHAERTSTLDKETRKGIPAPEERFDGARLENLIERLDWSKTPLGAMQAWPQSLKTIVRVLLTSRFAMWMSWGPELTFLYNDAYAKMTLGKKHPWALGKPSREVWKEIWEDIGPRIQRVLETGESTWDEALLLFLERSGYREETYHTFSYSPLSNDDGKVAGHLCVVTEETDRVIGERRVATLRYLAAELNKATNEADVASYVVQALSANQQDLPFTLTYLLANDATEAQLFCRTGIAAEHAAAPEAIELRAKNQPWPVDPAVIGRQSVLVEDVAARFASVPSGLWDIPPQKALIVPIASQGQSHPAGVIVAALNPYRQLDSSYEGFINLVGGQIAASIASVRAYEQERQRAEALSEIDRAKTEFFSNVSHEFRTPLTLMLGPIHDLLSRSQTHLTPTAKEQLELANRNGARLLRLVNTLLDFSRIEAGRVQAVYQATDLASFTEELASVFRSATDRAGIKLTVDCHKLSDSAYVDRDMWEKIVLNLISNAFKFTFEGEIKVTVRQTDHAAELIVRDTGVGIPEEELPRLFERFHRVPNTRSRTHEGSGIGLALVQELVRLHAGTIHVESKVNAGTVFTIRIPLGQDHLAKGQIGGERALSSTATGAAPFVEEALRWLPDLEPGEVLSGSIADYDLMAVPSPGASSETSASRPRVLIVDDNADMRFYVGRLLAERYGVAYAGNGKAALEAVRNLPPDLVMSDVMMPELDGFGLLQELRADARTRTIPIILLSAKAGEESRVEGLGAGADDYLVKPFSARELIARVGAHLNLARLRRQTEERITGILNSIGGGFHAIDKDWRFVAFNKGAERMFKQKGVDTESLLGQRFFEEAFPEARGSAVFLAMERTMKERVETTVENLYEPWQRWYQLRNYPTDDGGVATFFEDITERKHAEKNAEVVAQSVALQDLSRRVTKLQDDERRHIARELHDSAGQTLAALGMTLASIEGRCQKQDPQLGAVINDAKRMVQELSQEIRTTSYLLHPPLLDESGSTPRLKSILMAWRNEVISRLILKFRTT